MKRRSRARGYTVVELMMALGVFTMGAVGVFAMQRITLNSNQHAKNLTLASGIAQAWLGQLSADASLWRSGGTESGTDWLKSVIAAPDTWQLPTDNAALIDSRGFGRAFNVRGEAVAPTDNPVFCVHIRLTPLFIAPAGNGLTRTDVRVFWPREGVAPVAGDCTNAGTIDEVASSLDRYHFVYRTGAVRQNQ
jgi:Tfp pilus assembly protein PilV